MSKEIKKFVLNYYKEGENIICAYVHPRTGEEKKVKASEGFAEINDVIQYIDDLTEEYIVDIIVSEKTLILPAIELVRKTQKSDLIMVNKRTGIPINVPHPG